MNSNLLKSQMALHGKNQNDLAAACGITKGTLSKKLNGKREFTQGEICKIALLLKLSRELIISIFFAEAVA